jgi:hypothetical protein
MERPTPGGYKGRSAPGQLKSPSVLRTRRDDFELESSSDERDRAYMHDFQIRNLSDKKHTCWVCASQGTSSPPQWGLSQTEGK